MIKDILTKEEKLLLKEAGLSSTCLGQGLTILRKANFVTKWNYYQAFFLLTIAIERLLKLTIITHYRYENKGNFPQNSFLKSAGHDIKKLTEIVSSYDRSNVSIFSDDILSEILIFFTFFAKSSRYYNLDAITRTTSESDPLLLWKNIQQKIKKRHALVSSPPPEEIMKIASDSFIFIQHDEVGNLITDPRELYKDYKIVDKVQGYSVYYIWKIQEIADILRHFEYSANMLPSLREFFPYFVEDWRKEKEIIKVKDWNYLK